MDRRTFLKSASVTLSALAAGGAAYAFFWEPRRLIVRRVTVALPLLPPGLAGLRIAQISDTHHGPYTGRGFVEKAVGLVRAEKPDLVVLTGDYVHKDSAYTPAGIEPFALLRPPLGLFAVLGNHDHWHDADLTRECLARAGAVDLTNAHALAEKGGETICLAGVGDLWEDEQDLAAALDGVEESALRILLSHNPDYAELMPRTPRVDLMISGHTHGGQIDLPFLGAPVLPSSCGQKYRAGLVRGPRCPVFVSRGVGVISPPVRINCPPEVAVLTLVPAGAI